LSLIFSVLLISLVSLFSVQLVLNGRFSSRFKLLLLLVFSGIIIFYIRVGFGRYFTTIDESYYVSLLGNPFWYRDSIVSGYLTPFSLHVLRPLFSNPASEVVWYSVIMAMFYVLGTIFVYRRLGVTFGVSIVSSLLLLVTPLYLWNVIQTRPQQVGLLVGLVVVGIVLSMPLGRWMYMGTFLGFILLVFAHVLSFIVYSILLAMYFLMRMIFFEDSGAWHKYKVISTAIVFSWVIFLLFPYSRPIIRNMTWMFDSITGLGVSWGAFSLLSVELLFVCLVGGYFLVSSLRERIWRIWKSFLREYGKLSRGFQERHFRLLNLVLVFLILFIIYLQFHLGANVYTWVYRGSITTLLLFQVSNILFVLLYVKGLFQSICDSRVDSFELLSLGMVFIGLVFFAISFFMPTGKGVWGFHNWLIRALQYFVPLSGPVVAKSIMHDVDSFSWDWQRGLVSVLVSILIVLSIMNTARVPMVYNYDAVWTPELVNLCSESGHYIPRIQTSVYSRFVDGNLLRACGATLETNFSNVTSVSLSSDGFYRYFPNYRPISLADFKLALTGNLPLLVLVGGNQTLASYIGSIVPNSVVVYLNPGNECPLATQSKSWPVVVVGGPVSNPCVQKLDNEGALIVRLSGDSVITPRSEYSVPNSNPWWNREEGLFVIQALEYDGHKVLVIEGTDRDSTLAGVYYFVHNMYSSKDYFTATYLIGKWEELDGKVLDIAKGSLEDTNGFSPGDKVMIIEQG